MSPQKRQESSSIAGPTEPRKIKLSCHRDDFVIPMTGEFLMVDVDSDMLNTGIPHAETDCLVKIGADMRGVTLRNVLQPTPDFEQFMGKLNEHY